MQIEKIYISVSTLAGELNKTFKFSNGFNLIYSNGENAKGKTSLIRFIIWGLGFNVSLTNRFDSSSSDVKINIKNNPYIRIIERRNNKVRIIDHNGEIHYYTVPKQTDKISWLLMNKSGNVQLYSELLGLFYLDQDQGIRTWNLGNVSQSMSRTDSSYKINFKTILSGLKNVNYTNLNHRLYLINKQVSYINNLINAVKYFSSKQATSTKDVDTHLLDKISTLRLLKHRIKEHLSIYKNSLKNKSELLKLLNILDIRIRTTNGDQISVNSNNIITDHIKNTELKYFIHFYNEKLKLINNGLKLLHKKIKSIKNIKSTNKFYKGIGEEIALSGISIRDLEINRSHVTNIRTHIKDKMKKSINHNDFYNAAWHWTITFLRDLGITSGFFSYGNNKLLTRKIPYSGAQRSLIILTIRLSMYKVVMNHLKINLPLIIDSPGSQEMDDIYINRFIRNLRQYFPDTQLIIATNNKIHVKYDAKQNVSNGIFNDMKH